jgi:hypothetical protein
MTNIIKVIEPKRPELTQEQVNKYISNDSAVCPFCGSDDLQGSDTESNEGVITQYIECKTCVNGWDDIYTLNGIYTNQKHHYKKEKVFVAVEGGLVQDVLTTSQADMELVVIDHDTEGMDDEEMAEYTKAVAELAEAGEARSLMFG